MVRKHHIVIQVVLWLLTLGCVVYAVGGTGFAAIIAAIFVVALRVEANTGGMLVHWEQPDADGER